MSDIEKRLREYALNVSIGVMADAKETLTWQAADEIERLKAALQQYEWPPWRDRDLRVENERLRAALREVDDRCGGQCESAAIARAALEKKK